VGAQDLQQAFVLAPVGLERLELVAAADSFVVSIRSSRSAPRMPLRAAKTLIPLARAVLITAEAVALITAVTPPDWA
jgi:hypothetical protein